MARCNYTCLWPRAGGWAAKACDAKGDRHKQFLLILNLKKMETKKMSLANIQGRLSRKEMKNIMAGSGGAKCDSLCSGPCTVTCPGGSTAGSCHRNSSSGICYCWAVC